MISNLANKFVNIKLMIHSLRQKINTMITRKTANMSAKTHSNLIQAAQILMLIVLNSEGMIQMILASKPVNLKRVRSSLMVVKKSVRKRWLKSISYYQLTKKLTGTIVKHNVGRLREDVIANAEQR